MKRIKNYLIKIIGMNNYRTLIVVFFRFINGYHKKIDLCIDKNKLKTIKEKNRNVYFGYYDHPSVNNKNVLFISTTDNKRNPAEICVYNMENDKTYKITKTNAWNYQMGSRLRWIKKDEIIFNDYKKDKGYISRKININTKEEKEYNFPIYDISKNKKYSFYTDFTILNINRPEYGYQNIEKIISKDMSADDTVKMILKNCTKNIS